MAPHPNLDLSIGSAVTFADDHWIIDGYPSLSTVLLHKPTTDDQIVASIDDLTPVEPAVAPLTVCASDIVHLSSSAWDEAKRREAVIAPLAAQAVVPDHLACEAAEALHLSRRTIYTLIERYRASGGMLSALAPHPPTGGRGKGRLSPGLEGIIATTIGEFYLSPQRYRPVAVIEEIRRRCYRAGLQPPSGKAIRHRLRALQTTESVRRRHGPKATQPLKPVIGTYPPVSHPLEVVQMDHTRVDCIVVDAHTRRPIGRPFLTVGIDVYSRCITGVCLTLEAPSAISVGLCLAHSVLDKTVYLKRLGVEGEWPIWGKPDTVEVDNGSEFHSEALRRGCEQHGIRLVHRPPAQPHFGGIIERLIGTLMQHVHTLPGTTFSHIQERGAYDAEHHAALTLQELEKWLAFVIVGHYHSTAHRMLHEPPIERLKQGLLGTPEVPGPGPRPRIHDRQAFLVDFLPLHRRTIQRHGFVLDHIGYYSNALRPWIAERARLAPFIIRRDPRDISRIFVLDPEREAYVEVPYRMLQRPAMTLWEHRESVRRLRQAGAAKVDEAAIFRTVETMREITKAAAAHTKAARRRQARLENALSATAPQLHPVSESPPESSGAEQTHFEAIPFDDIEEWDHGH
jgi:putative transposase